MRTLRQILHGCKKHHYVYFRDIKWFEDAHCIDGYKTKLICKKCMHVENSKVDMNICRSTLDYIAYGKLNHKSLSLRKPKIEGGYQPNDIGHIRVIRKPPVKP